MNPSLLLVLPFLLCVPPGSSQGAELMNPGPIASDSLPEVYRSAMTWEEFHAGADARRELWDRNWSRASVPGQLRSRAEAAGGPWRILAIVEPGCSDSVSTLPYLARLAGEVASLELRVTDSNQGRPWMEDHRTPDGRAATPTFLLLNEAHQVRGCWVEQPAALQEFWLEALARGEAREEFERKMAWYEEDGGAETLREFVEILEAAHSGSSICPGASETTPPSR